VKNWKPRKEFEMQTLSKEAYESTRPATEQKIQFDNFVVRAYTEDGELHVLIHRKNLDGREMLPLAYMLGTNAATLK
jgi:hypothetical protein